MNKTDARELAKSIQIYTRPYCTWTQGDDLASQTQSTFISESARRWRMNVFDSTEASEVLAQLCDEIQSGDPDITITFVGEKDGINCIVKSSFEDGNFDTEIKFDSDGISGKQRRTLCVYDGSIGCNLDDSEQEPVIVSSGKTPQTDIDHYDSAIAQLGELHRISFGITKSIQGNVMFGLRMRDNYKTTT